METSFEVPSLTCEGHQAKTLATLRLLYSFPVTGRSPPLILLFLRCQECQNVPKWK